MQCVLLHGNEFQFQPKHAAVRDQSMRHMDTSIVDPWSQAFHQQGHLWIPRNVVHLECLCIKVKSRTFIQVVVIVACNYKKKPKKESTLYQTQCVNLCNDISQENKSMYQCQVKSSYYDSLDIARGWKAMYSLLVRPPGYLIVLKKDDCSKPCWMMVD